MAPTFFVNGQRHDGDFQGLLGLLHGALDELDLSELPRRGAWGSVTARNFPSALAETFERALLRSAKKGSQKADFRLSGRLLELLAPFQSEENGR